jgi:hypothetical protein
MKIFSEYDERNIFFDQNVRTFQVEDVPRVAEGKFIEMVSNTVIKSEFST